MRNLFFGMVFILIATIVVTIVAGESNYFENEDAFFNFLIEQGLAPSNERLTIDTLYSAEENVKIVIPKDVEVSTITNTWPVLIYWNNSKGIVINEMAETAPTTRVAWGGMSVDTMCRAFCGYKKAKVYAIELKDSLIQVTNEIKGATSCFRDVNLYIALLEENQKSVRMLTERPIKIEIHGPCKSTKKTLGWECKNDTLVITGNSAAEEQKSWVGSYIIQSNKLSRAQGFGKYVREMNKAHNRALKFYRKNELQKAIDVLSPFIYHGPKDGINEETVTAYNDYGFFLAENTEYKEALGILYDVVSKFPKRNVAHLNIADVYHALGIKLGARKHYEIYMDLMVAGKMKNKIPQRVIERIK